MREIKGTAEFRISLPEANRVESEADKEANMIDVKQAVSCAAELLQGLMPGIDPSSILLEEVESPSNGTDNTWVVSLSFYARNPKAVGKTILTQFEPEQVRRAKRITMNAEGGFISLKELN